MKISKLFHWLYAFLLFLPLIVFIPNAFYFGFNKEAVAEERVMLEPVYYQTNTIEVYSDFLVDRVYKWEDDFTPVVTNQSRELMTVEMVSGQYNGSQGILYSGSSGSLIFYFDSNFNIVDSKPFDFLVISIGSQLADIPSGTLSHFGTSNLNIIQSYTPVTYSMSISDSMVFAWDSTWTNPLFSWSYDSYLTQPFLYITNMFGIPNDSTLIYTFSYWLSISIIWLCFDVIMYVPLLAHRWLDKASLE